MDSFENICKLLLEEEHYWVRQSFKVNLTGDEKKAIGRHSIPRPEIDLIAFDALANEVIAIEVKSFLDSMGMNYDDITRSYNIPTEKYNLFTYQNYRKITISRLKKDLIAQGLIARSTRIKTGFIAGNVYKNEHDRMKKYFARRKWFYWGPEEVREKILQLAQKGYENNTVVMAAKILGRA